MYKAYFGLSELPFTIGPNPKYLYLSDQHREAMAHLLYGLSEQGGFVLLTGEVGTGKTTLCRSVLQQQPDNVEVALILNPRATSIELLQYICDELKIDYRGSDSAKVLNDALNHYLLDAYANDRRVVVMIDEAQQLSIETLEQVRLLTNLETNKDKLMQIILVGQPELNDMLSSKHLRQLSQRIKSRYHLGELDLQQLGAYIKNRLRVAGCERELFSKKAIKKIYSYTKGVPRLINVLCDRCLMGAYATDRAIVDHQVVDQAAKEVFGNYHASADSDVMKWVSFAVVVVGLLFAIVWGAMQYQPQWFNKLGITDAAQATQKND